MFQLTTSLLLVLLLSSCMLTKVVTVPMRVGGAVISAVPVVGDSVDAVIDTAADVVDAAPI
ncbi:MAG: hypothetical protein PSN36_05325 [Gammaproteobacteria bacterium]|nr:hypothetical protein [Gammaproteobacteria bacterium]